MLRKSLFAQILVCAIMTAGVTSADSYVTTSDKDNTLYENDNGGVSNGAGEFMFSGRTTRFGVRRAVLSFDLGPIPAGSTIDSVSLQLHVSRSRSGAELMDLHRLISGWGEAASDAGDPGGEGAEAMPGDATWTNRFHEGASWATDGGDFLAGSSASANVSGTGNYLWTGAGLVNDVQAWLDGTATNAGWILIGLELTDSTAKRFDTRENSNPDFRPQLTVNYTPIPEPASLCMLLLAAAAIRRRG